MEEVIEEKESLRDLGVMMTNSAFIHINLVCKKVIQKSGLIFRTFQSRDKFFLTYMWKTLIQPQIENLFRNLSRKIPELKAMDY